MKGPTPHITKDFVTYSSQGFPRNAYNNIRISLILMQFGLCKAPAYFFVVLIETIYVYIYLCKSSALHVFGGLWEAPPVILGVKDSYLI